MFISKSTRTVEISACSTIELDTSFEAVSHTHWVQTGDKDMLVVPDFFWYLESMGGTGRRSEAPGAGRTGGDGGGVMHLGAVRGRPGEV